jgi:hypothetical protein
VRRFRLWELALFVEEAAKIIVAGGQVAAVSGLGRVIGRQLLLHGQGCLVFRYRVRQPRGLLEQNAQAIVGECQGAPVQGIVGG